MMYEFSVLMSLYNKEDPRFLDECLSSLSSQILKATEIIVVYDGFINQELDAVIKKYSTSLPIEVVKIEKNVGLGEALNYGLRFCNYELVARMDTDDICLNDRFIKQIPEIANSDIDILGSSVTEFDGSKRRNKDVPESYESIVSACIYKNPINHMSVVFKKEKILNIGSYMHHLYMEDYNLWLRAIENKLIIKNLKERLLLVRVNPNMVKRRRGLEYIKSEIQLFKLKHRMRIYPLANLLYYSMVRIGTRLLPWRILSLIYNLDRKLLRK